MNGGMYEADLSPLGLYIENGKTLRQPNTANAAGNFYLKPNGVFYVNGQEAGILTTERRPTSDGKAMIVCMSRRICVALYEAIVKLRPQWHSDDDETGAIKVVMTGAASDPLAWQAHIGQRAKARRELIAKRVKNLMEDVPNLPNFSHFHEAFRGDAGAHTPEGDMRTAFFGAYNAAGCEFVPLNSKQVDERLKSGPPLISANFVIPYPPGFPIMVPGQVLTTETIEFMRKLDVKEIHGYEAGRGLKLLRPDALGKRGGQRAAAE